MCILIGLLAVFIARRRSYLKERLIENINNFGKKSFSDEEKLVKNDEQKSCSSFWCFKSKKNKNQPQQQTSHLDYTVSNFNLKKIYIFLIRLNYDD